MWLGPFFRRSGPAVVRHNSLHLLASVHRRGRAQPGIPRPLSPSLVVSLQRLRPPPSLPCQSLSAASNAAATAALLDLHPSSPVTAAVSAQVGPLCACLLPRSPYSRRPPEPPVLPKQVDSLLSPDVFNRPDVVLSLQVVGAPASWAAAAAAGGAGVLTHLTSDTDAVAASLAPLAGHAVQDSCAGACSDAACVATVLGGGQLLRSEVEALSPATAASLGCFFTSLRAAVAAPDAALLLGRLDLSELASSTVAGAAVLAAAQEVLKAARGEAAAMQLVFLDATPATPLSSLRPEGVQRRKLRAAWHATARHLAQALPSDATAPAPAAAASSRDVNAWYAKVAGFGVGIMLLVAIIGTVIALCTLPTGQDTLLYARNKGD